MASSPRKVDDKVGSWHLIENLGEGGNGTVWKASSDDGRQCALKILKNNDKINLSRFAAEIEGLKRAAGIEGVITLLDYHIKDDGSDRPYWLSMPLAESFNSLVGKMKPRDIVLEFIKLSKTLTTLHDIGIFHRDIKPANILNFGGRLCFSDFGLVTFPDKPAVTPEHRDVGAKFTMAPEMRREPTKATPGPADIYSLAKTLWIALTENEYSFDGQYFPTTNLALSNYHPDLFTHPLDNLLSLCTSNEPNRRPTPRQFTASLKEWVDVDGDFDRRNSLEWGEIQNIIFPHGAPQTAIWSNIDSIINVLKLACKSVSLNHMFLPTGGGMTLSEVSHALEDGFIELDVGWTIYIKPKRLIFENFGSKSYWNYFRIECESVNATGFDTTVQGDLKEEICELRPGKYGPYSLWEGRNERQTPLPDGARPVERYLGGAFVIFNTRSPYNLTSSTYDARHNKMNSDQFREYIKRSVDHSRH